MYKRYTIATMPQNWVDNRSFISFYFLFQIYTIFITKFIVFGLFLKFGLKTHTPSPYNSICLFFWSRCILDFKRGVVARILELFIINSYLLEFKIWNFDSCCVTVSSPDGSGILWLWGSEPQI